jgi:hypothetical protein
LKSQISAKVPARLKMIGARSVKLSTSREIIMLKQLSIAGICALALAGCHHPMPKPTPGTSIGAGNPYPVSNYTCEDGTRLAVRLFGESASVSVNGAAPVNLPTMGPEGTTYSNGRQTLTIVQGRMSWGLGRAVPSACSGG